MPYNTAAMDQEAAPHPALLPPGFVDLLPPEADIEALGVEAAMAVFAAHGYARVKPPILEFEESFAHGSGAAVIGESFRIMDPASHRMMVLRPDITPQIARIAATRLAAEPRPLRLSYAGQCVRVRATSPAAFRQVPQAGLELIGADSAAADAEIMIIAGEALAAMGLRRISLDLTLPTLVPKLLDEAGIAGAPRQALAHALDRKDVSAVNQHAGPLAPMLTTLLLAAGPAPQALEALRQAHLPPPCRALAQRLEQVVAHLQHAAPSLHITVDPVEFRGFEYHTGLAVTVFAPGHTTELGRGGRYFSNDQEPATGITLYADAIFRASAKPAARHRVFVPAGTSPQAAALLRQQGFATVAGLHETAAPHAEAARVGCTHVFVSGALVKL